MSTFQSRCPVIRRGMQAFVEHVAAGGRSWWEPFEREVLWIREARALQRALHGGEEIADGSEFHDFYGFLTCAKSAVKEARGQAARYKVTASSSLVILAEVEVFERPALKFVELDPDRYDAQNRARDRERHGIETYHTIPTEWRLPVDPPDPGAWPFRPRLEPVIVAPWTVVWSSTEPELDPDLVVAILRRRWSPEVSRG